MHSGPRISDLACLVYAFFRPAILRLCQGERRWYLVVLDLRAALLGRALLIGALDLAGAFHGDQAVGAGEKCAESVAALLGGALLVLALDLVCVWHGDEAVGARVGRAEGVTTLLWGALAVLALGLVGVRHGDEAVRAADGVAELDLAVGGNHLFWTVARGGRGIVRRSCEGRSARTCQSCCKRSPVEVSRRSGGKNAR